MSPSPLLILGNKQPDRHRRESQFHGVSDAAAAGDETTHPVSLTRLVCILHSPNHADRIIDEPGYFRDALENDFFWINGKFAIAEFGDAGNDHAFSDEHVTVAVQEPAFANEARCGTCDAGIWNEVDQLPVRVDFFGSCF
ncbi:hypothetical protein DESC_740238 [Desulfosarcina cetonica]|nr:hypothetical protein DESC_740238 [Desulfosarcina cetonica]